MIVLETDRLTLRHLNDADAGFIFALLNDPDFIRNIADRGIRTELDARNYIRKGPMASYQLHGFGLNAVIEKATGEPIGMCGLLRRDVLPQPDVGYAFLPAFRGKGFALESVLAMKNHGHSVFGFKTIQAIVNPDNLRSIRVLEKCGFAYEKEMILQTDSPAVLVYASSLGG